MKIARTIACLLCLLLGGWNKHGSGDILGNFGQFYGVQNFLLRRDLDPASNDNSPVGLDRAA